MMEDDGGAPEDGGLISVGELGDGRRFEEDCAAERGERRVGEVDVDDLRRKQETSELLDGHRLLRRPCRRSSLRHGAGSPVHVIEELL